MQVWRAVRVHRQGNGEWVTLAGSDVLIYRFEMASLLSVPSNEMQRAVNSAKQFKDGVIELAGPVMVQYGDAVLGCEQTYDAVTTVLKEAKQFAGTNFWVPLPAMVQAMVRARRNWKKSVDLSDSCLDWVRSAAPLSRDAVKAPAWVEQLTIRAPPN